MRARALFSVLAVVIALTRGAAAQGTDAAAATALFQEGREAAKKGDYTTACLKMEESLRLDPAVGTLLNLADCQAHLGHVATAWQLFQQAADKLPATDTRLAAVKQRVAALEARLPRLTVSLAPGTPRDARITRDGIALGAGSLDTALPVDPGAHVVVASAPGRAEQRYPVDVGEGHTERVVVDLAPAQVQSPSRDAAPAPSRGVSNRVIAGLAVGGAGVILLGAAVGTGLALPSKQQTVNQNCGAAVHLPADRCNATGFDAAQSGKTLSTANTATWIAGGLAAAAGATLIVVGIVGRTRPAPAVHVGISPGFVRLDGSFE